MAGTPEAATLTFASEALAICAQVERGHGRGTLAARFEQVKAAANGSGPGSEPVALAVALSDAALQPLVSWALRLDGIDPVTLPEGACIVVETSRDHGYALASATGGRRALGGSDALRTELLALSRRPVPPGTSIMIEVPRIAGPWTRLELMTAPLASRAFRSEALATALADGACLALVAGAEDHAFAGPDRAVLRDLAAMLPVMQALLTPAEGGPRSARPWWEDPAIASALRLDAILLRQDLVLPLLSGSAPQPAAKTANAIGQLRVLHATLDGLGGALVRETARQRALKGREDRVLRAMESRSAHGGERDASDRIRQRLDEGIARIERQIEDQNRRALLPNGNLNQAVTETLKAFSEQEIEQTEAFNEIRVAIRSDYAARLLDTAKKEIRNQFKDDVHQIRIGVEACREALAGDLARATGARQTLAVGQVDENTIWRSLREALSLQLAYHGTLPKRGFWQRLGEGKQLMFTMLSLLGLSGMVFGFTRSEIAPLLALGLPVIFFVGVGLTFWNWKQEDAARLGKELERIREQVSMEVKRLIGEIQREKMMRLKEVLDATRRDFSRRIDAALKEHQTASGEQTTRARNEARERQRALEQRQRELQPLGMQLARLRQGCADALRDALESLRAQSRPGGAA